MKRLFARAYSIAGGGSAARKAIEAAQAPALEQARATAARAGRRSPVIRMCSPRRSATTAPSIDEPEKQDRGQLVRPDERRVEHVARDDAGERARRSRRRRGCAAGQLRRRRRATGRRSLCPGNRGRRPAGSGTVATADVHAIARAGRALAQASLPTAFEHAPGLVAELAPPFLVEARFAQLGAEALG